MLSSKGKFDLFIYKSAVDFCAFHVTKYTKFVFLLYTDYASSLYDERK